MSKVLVSGVKPTGRPHIGNYFGAMKQFVDLQDKYESRIFVANLHALTTVQDKKELEQNSWEMVLDYLAIGLDPKKTTIYLQSDVPHVAELSWIFACLTTMPYLMRAHAFKDAEAKNKDINVGTFNYPLLMAADILVHDADLVPVGPDQKQHLEITRDTAEKFNRVFGETFKIPEAWPSDPTPANPGNIAGSDGRKMSKSYENDLGIFATDEEIKKFVMSIVTNSELKIPVSVYNIHVPVAHALGGESELSRAYDENRGNYKMLKELLIEDLIKLITPLRDRRKEWEGKSDEIKKLLTENGKKMREIVHKKMVEVRKKTGLIHHESR